MIINYIQWEKYLSINTVEIRKYITTVRTFKYSHCMLLMNTKKEEEFNKFYKIKYKKNLRHIAIVLHVENPCLKEIISYGNDRRAKVIFIYAYMYV